MGAGCAKQNKSRELEDVRHQTMLMDNSEVAILKIDKTQMANPKSKKIKQMDKYC